MDLTSGPLFRDKTTLPSLNNDIRKSALDKCYLAPGGYLLCEEHLITDLEVIGPTSLNYRVAPGDLREAVSAVDVLLYQESIETNSEGDQVASARVVAKKQQRKIC
jgi:hypothetical protein